MNRNWKMLCLALLLVSRNVCALNTLPTGQEWRTWGEETRLLYVSAYLSGYWNGFNGGCTTGQRLYSAGKAKDISGLPGEKCIPKALTYSQPLETYVSAISSYYTSFPGDKNVPVYKLLEGLSDQRRLTIQQMHSYFPSGIRKSE